MHPNEVSTPQKAGKVGQTQAQQTSPSKIDSFKSNFFGLIRNLSDKSKPNKQPIIEDIESLLINNRRILSQKVILHLYIAEPKLYDQFRFLLLSLSLILDRKQQYDSRWGNFYQIVNQILKIPKQYRQRGDIERHTIDFTMFLINPQNTIFFQKFPSTLKLINSQLYQNVCNNHHLSNNLTKQQSQDHSKLIVKKIVRVFNSLLCFKFAKVQDYIILVYQFAIKAQDYTQFLINIEQKFIKRLNQFQSNSNQAKQKQEIQNSICILNLNQIYDLLNIFCQIDPQNKLRSLLKPELVHQIGHQQNMNNIYEKHYIVCGEQINKAKQNNKKTNTRKNSQNVQNLSPDIKSQHNTHIIFDQVMKLILKEIIKNKQIKIATKKLFILHCFNQISKIDQQLFQYLLEAEGNEENQQISQVILKTVQRQSLKYITVSRLKAILKRINLSKNLTYQSNMKKIFKILRLIYWVAKKFNQSSPTFLLNLNSSILLQNLEDAVMIIFSINFNTPQVGQVIQLQINKVIFNVLIKYTETSQSTAIEVIIQADGHQKIKQKKQINKWSYILCMVGLTDKKTLSLSIDGAYFKLPLKQSATKISKIQFGPYSGSLKNVYVLNKIYQMIQMHKNYFQRFRKMNLMLQQLGQKSFLFTLDKKKIQQKTKWFWKKQLKVQYNNLQKLRSISFGDGVEQLGGFPALLFLVTRVINSEKSQELVNFLNDFFQFLKVFVNQSDTKQTQKWMQSSTVYFGQFIWLLLSRNQHLRTERQLFNRVFDFFGWFFQPTIGQPNTALKLLIIKDIYLNFQIWSKCSVPIKIMLFTQLSKRMQDNVILIQMFNNSDYERIMSSIIFFFLDENVDQTGERVLQISGVKISPIHEHISRLGSKILELNYKQKLPINYDSVKKDLMVLVSLINIFFYKKHLYFGKNQLSALAILISHYLKHFMGSQLFERTFDQQIYVFSQLTSLIAKCPQHCQLIYLLFQLTFILITDLQNIKNGTALIIDNFTMNQKRGEDDLQFSFKRTMFVVKSSNILYQPNNVFSLEKILSVLLGSLRNKANSNKQQKKLTYSVVTKQFQKFSYNKLLILLSLNQFCMVFKQCVEPEQLFPTAVFFLKTIIKNQLLPEATQLANICIAIIYQHKSLLLFQSLQQFPTQCKILEQQDIEKSPRKHQITVIQQQLYLRRGTQSTQKDQSKLQQPPLLKLESNQQISLQKSSQYLENYQTPIKSLGQLKQVSSQIKLTASNGYQQKNELVESKMLTATLNITNQSRRSRRSSKSRIRDIKQLKDLSVNILKQLFKQYDLQTLFKYCKSPQLLQILIRLDVIYNSNATFQIPVNTVKWEKLTNKQYGGNWMTIVRIQNFSNEQLKELVKYFQKKNKPQKNGKQSNENVQGKDYLEILAPFFILYQSLFNLTSQISKSNNKINYSDYSSVLKIMAKLVKDSLQQITSLFVSIQTNKKSIADLNKRLESQTQLKIQQLVDISSKISNQIEIGRLTTIVFEKPLYQFFAKLQSGQFSKVSENSKFIKKLVDEMKQLIDNFQFLISLFYKKRLNKNSKSKAQTPFISMFNRKKLQSSKKKRLQEIADEQNKLIYSQQLKNTPIQLCKKLQRQSAKKQQTWKSLYQQNNFWVSSKIKNNQCYEIHPKTTGFYRLNIIKTAFDDVPYPRRKSFQHELQIQVGQNELQASKMTQAQLMKTIGLGQQTQSRQSKANSMEAPYTISHIIRRNKREIYKDPFYAEYVTQRGVYAGILYYNPEQSCFVFRSKGYDFLPNSIVYKYSTIFHRIEDTQYKIIIQINNKSQVFARRYIHRHTAIQIFSHHKSYFFNLFYKESREKFFKNYSNKVITGIVDLQAEFQRRKYTEKWMNGEIDNFQYLMIINLFCGRTINDLAQYPVMPWVITNYQQHQMELNKDFLKDPKNIRDLSKPAGKINERKFQNLKMRCQQIGDEDMESKFLYGTMYSNPTVIYNFFIRLEPFTTLHWEHQGRKIDHADRLFSAVKDQFNTVVTSTSDNKELVPQFYYWPQFLKNRNKVNLGIKQNKQQVHDVKLPGWAKNPQQFIFKMRQVLESAEVSKNINHWIDLVFGYKNPKQVALQYDNLFHYRTYEHDIFQTQHQQQLIKGAQITISQFGQIPNPIFSKPHPQKQLTYSQNFKIDSFVILKKPSTKKIVNFELLDEGFFLGYEKEVTFYANQFKKSLQSHLQKPTKDYSSEGTVVRVIDFVNNIWLTLKDGVFRIFEKKQRVCQFDAEMQCFSFFGRYIIYGFRSQLIVSRIEINFKLSKHNSFYGHKSNIYKIDVSVVLDLIVSIDESGLVLVHEFSKQKLQRQFELGPKVQVTHLCIHQMGYFIFFTKDQKLIIYTFLGQLFFNQDIGVNNRGITQKITKVAIFQQNRSLLLISTDRCKIYLVDFLQIKRFNLNSSYKQYCRFKNNILQNCPKLEVLSPIQDFAVRRTPGQNVITYKFYVLLQNNAILLYYSSEQIQQKIKTNKILGQLGLF